MATSISLAIPLEMVLPSTHTSEHLPISTMSINMASSRSSGFSSSINCGNIRWGAIGIQFWSKANLQKLRAFLMFPSTSPE
ncbi:hypothetical protein CKR_2357 [Clostridium kluyveri NBRC 12016]|uniref:Uncharacterized protein n=1 Tax=Clostridium kluyveri (strain NBRC 12016) TaxID=583346 RepID=B9E4I3_CLOK1|nr:hypothetical protein CKR_2357 [Clostridium kluyveri NBRC 12016]